MVHTRPAPDFGALNANPTLLEDFEPKSCLIFRVVVMSDVSAPVILCVDDTATEAELRLLKSVLENAGFRVLATRNAQEALELVRKNDIELILTEHITPVKSGPTLAQTLKQLNPGVPVAIYTGAWTLPPDVMEMADQLIPKLVSIDELLCTIEELLGRTRTRAAA